MSEIINVGLIGFGLSGRAFHAPIITSVKGFNFTKIRETKEENIKIIKENYPMAEVVNDSSEIISDKNIDLVIVTSPNVTHYTLAREALMAGKHVVVEKPFTVTSEEADELVHLAKKQNKILTVYHNRRWDSDFKTVKKIIENNMLGNIVEYESHFDRFRPKTKNNTWKEQGSAGSGILYDLGSHLIDQAQILFGLPKEITCHLGIQRQDSKIIDNFELLLHYNNLKVTLKAGMLVRQLGPHFIVNGDKGSFIKYGMDVQEDILRNGLSPKNMENWGEEPKELWGRIDTGYKGLHLIGNIESDNGDYREFYENVYNTIIGKEELIVKPEEARNTIKVIELAMKSHEEKRTVIFSN